MIREITIEDHDQLIDLFSTTPVITLCDADSFEATKSYLERNPGLNFVKVVNDEIIGCVMCGHDGRRGYIQHLIVKPEYRRKGFGTLLFQACLDGLKQIGINKSHGQCWQLRR